MFIPAYIICWNNGWLVRNTVAALKRFPQVRCVVVDNNSGPRTQAVLDELYQEGVEIIRFRQNYGHTVVADMIHPNAQYYIVTDPDLGLETLPLDTVDRLMTLSQEFRALRMGLALEISNTADLLEGASQFGKTISQWESNHWARPVKNSANLEMYDANIDTTFALHNTAVREGGQYRLAGPYTVKHLMWHKSWVRDLDEEDFNEYFNQPDNRSSTTAQLVKNYRATILPATLSVTKRAVQFKVVATDKNSRFWTQHYPNWEIDTFNVFDRYANPHTIVVDIGAWIGPTVLYNASNFERVIAVEADRLSIAELEANIAANKLQERVTVVKKAIYSEITTVHFGVNQFLPNSGENESTSQIQTGTGGYPVPTITVAALLEGIDPSTIGLIKVDIEGSEEAIMEDLLHYHLDHHVPLYLSFHYDWWRDKAKLQALAPLFQRTNITETAIDLVQRQPFCSLLFRPQ
jgi:FkbM family methyltransferase